MPRTQALTGPATENIVRSVFCPKPTETWMPIPHGMLLDEVEKALSEMELTIDGTTKRFGLQRDGDQMCGVFDLVDYDDDELGYGFSIAVRNSMDKSLSAALCFGSRVFVNNNLSMSGEETIARKHTKHILRDLPVLVRQALSKFEHFQVFQHNLFLAMQDVFIGNEKVHDVLCKALRCNAIPATFIPRVIAEWDKPSYNVFLRRTVWSLYNAFTEIFKPSFNKNPLVASERTIRLTQLFQDEFEELRSF